MPLSVSSSENLVYVFDGFTLDAQRRSLSLGASEVVLGSRALDLLIALVEQAGEVLSREHLVARVWPRTFVEDSSLRVHVAALRKALEAGAGERRYIANVPGRGYSFVGQVERRPRPLPVPAVAAERPPVTRLTGRESTLVTLVAMVGRCPIVSIVGPGGIGKTSVAREACLRLAAGFAGGTCWVDLSEPHPAGPAVQVAVALGLPDAGLAGLTAALRHVERLVVLDNCEQVLEDVASLVETIGRHAPGLRLICTSREPLSVAGEHVLRLEPLALAPATARTLADALQSPAVALFVERARAAADTVVFSDADVPGLFELCRQLDGIPLALELAARRVPALGLKGLLARPEDWLALLTRGRRGAQPRHQSLRAAIDWSHDLLDATERRVLACLAVFDTPFSLASAAAVVRALPGQANTEEVVLRLVDRSLLLPLHAHDTDDGTAYRLLRAVRLYALERLADQPDAGAVRARHALEMQRLAHRRPSAMVDA